MSVSAVPVPERVLAELQSRYADRVTLERQRRAAAGLPELAGESERQHGLSVLRAVVGEHVRSLAEAGGELPESSYDLQLLATLRARIHGAGSLQELLDDPGVENIDLNGAAEVWVTYGDERGKQRHLPVAASDEELVQLVVTLAGSVGVNARPFTAASPELDLRLPDGSRLSAVQRAGERPVVSIRRNRFPQLFLASVPEQVAPQAERMTLVGLGCLEPQLAEFLAAAVRARCNVMVAGATDAGKTSLLRALVHCIPPPERLITIERALELGLTRHPQLHQDVVEWEEVLPDAEGQGGISIDQLVRRSRRHNPSRVIVGEVIGPEVTSMLNAMSQGNDGSLSTIHARSGTDVFDRLATYAAQFDGLSFATTYALIAGAIDFVVFVRKLPDGRRAVGEVLEVTGLAEGHVARSRIFAPSPVTGLAERVPEVAIARAGALTAAGYSDAEHGAGLFAVPDPWGR